MFKNQNHRSSQNKINVSYFNIVIKIKRSIRFIKAFSLDVAVRGLYSVLYIVCPATEWENIKLAIHWLANKLPGMYLS